MILTPKQKVRKAIEGIFDYHPLFASVVARWKITPTDKVPTFATNGPELFYNPAFAERWNIAEVTWIILHEAGHVFLGHHLRADEMPERTRANVAMDLALNWLIRDQRMSPALAEFACIPGTGKFAGFAGDRSAEFYYDKLAPEQSGSETPQDARGSGEGEGASEAEKPAKGDPGSGNGASEGGLDQALPGTIGDVLPFPGIEDGTDADRMAAEAEWQEIVAQAINTARVAGKLPGWLYEKASELIGKSKINPRLLLKRFMTEFASDGFSYERPNRRSCWRRDVILPARKSRDSGKGCVIVDTSGSMSESDCNAALREIENVLRGFPQAEVTMLQCDTRNIEEAERTFTRFDFPLRAPGTWFGRGGTDLDPALAEVRNRAGQFKWLIVVSDMMWSCQAVKPVGVPTLWFHVGDWAMDGKPPFGQVVKCPSGKES